MQRGIFSFVAAIFAVLVWSSVASAATYYVAPAPAGNDMNAGSEAAPFLTIQKAASVVVAGDEIVVTPGTYAGAKFTTSGTPASPILVHGMEGAIVASPGALNTGGDILWVRGASYVTIDGFEVKNAPRAGIAIEGDPGDGLIFGNVVTNNFSHNNSAWGIFAVNAVGVRIEGNVTTFSVNESGIQVLNCPVGPQVVGNTSHDNENSGIEFLADPVVLPNVAVFTNALVDSNTLYENGASGAAALFLGSSQFALVSNNLLYDNHGAGIQAVNTIGDPDGASIGNRFFNNTIVQAVDGGYPISFDDAALNNSVNNNILMHRGALGSLEFVDAASEQGLVSDYNIIFGLISVNGTLYDLTQWRARGHDASSFSAAASDVFVNQASNFALKPDSPAIDRGRPVTGVLLDIIGTVRPQGSSYDIGAYEYFVPAPENNPPVANAGNDQTVAIGANVALNGTGSTDPDGDTLSYAWTQIEGPVVTLAGAATAIASFTAPSVEATTDFAFRLTVSDGNGGSSTDMVTVTVEAPPIPVITILSPVGGESWKTKTKKQIRWFPDPGVTGNARIEVSRDGGATFETIIDSVDVVKGKKKWTVKGPTTSTAKIRVVLISDPRVQGTTPGTFTIRK